MPSTPDHSTVVSSSFTISGAKVVWLIVMTVLGGVYICGILIYALISHFSIRCLLPWFRGGGLAGDWVSERCPKRGRQSRKGEGTSQELAVRNHLGADR